MWAFGKRQTFNLVKYTSHHWFATALRVRSAQPCFARFAGTLNEVRYDKKLRKSTFRSGRDVKSQFALAREGSVPLSLSLRNCSAAALRSENSSRRMALASLPWRLEYAERNLGPLHV